MKNKRLVYALSIVAIFFVNSIWAHPSPNSAILLDIQSKGVSVELQLPLSELCLALGSSEGFNPLTLIEQQGNQLKTYILEHIHPLSIDNQKWTVEIRDMSVQTIEQELQGKIPDLIVHLWLQPPTGASNRVFTLNYDLIMHQVVTHNALVSIRQDWETGVIAEHPVEVGVIAVDTRNNKIYPLSINQEEGGLWRGFKSMTRLGMDHIAEGTDHLMFLLVLLLAAPLLVRGNRWGTYGGLRYSLIRLVKIITAFTIGHSITLIIGAVGLVRLPSQPIEVMIAFSILISAIHAIRPIFPQKEAYIAIGFGLIHGLAFANTLSHLNLPLVQMALSILGFNIGIELMQLFVMLLIVPWLILLSQGSLYTPLRVGGAIFAAVVAGAWMLERVSNKPNIISIFASTINDKALVAIVILALASIISYGFEPKKIIK